MKGKCVVARTFARCTADISSPRLKRACSPSAMTTRLAVFLDRDMKGDGAGEYVVEFTAGCFLSIAALIIGPPGDANGRNG